MKQYLELLARILTQGARKDDRTGTGTLSVFGHQMRFDLAEGFPLLTTKKLHTKSIVHELLWMLAGNTNVQYLNDNGVTIWDEWANDQGDLGPVYGKQWRAWPGHEGEVIDQMAELVHALKHNPHSRRHVISAWNVADLHLMGLQPCHCLFQFDVTQGRLSCQLYQRSCDVFLGVPFNIASYALLTHLVAHQCDLVPAEFIWVGGDCHLYVNHLDQAREQLLREPLPLPLLSLAYPRPADLFSYKYEDITFERYQAHPPIKAKVSV